MRRLLRYADPLQQKPLRKTSSMPLFDGICRSIPSQIRFSVVTPVGLEFSPHPLLLWAIFPMSPNCGILRKWYIQELGGKLYHKYNSRGQPTRSVKEKVGPSL